MNPIQSLTLLGILSLLVACTTSRQTEESLEESPQASTQLVSSVCIPPLPIAGRLDPCLSGDGKQTTTWTGTSYEVAEAVAMGPGQEIVVGGTYSPYFAVARYKPNGSLDTSFSNNGKVKTDFGNSAFLNDVAVQSDGKIVAVGYTLNANWDLALARYNTDGTPDTSFGGDGKVTTEVAIGQDDFATAVALQTDGKIVVAGYSGAAGANRDFIVLRYNSDGSLDTSFDSDGKVLTDMGTDYDYAQTVAIQTDGKIVLGGDVMGFSLARYNGNGSLDTSFDFDGKTSVAFGMGARGLALQSDGKIVMVGYDYDANNEYDFALARFNSDGSLDTSFDGDGMTQTDFSSSADSAYTVMVQADGKIIAGGTSDQSGTTDFALVRYNSDGSLDTAFDTDGRVTTDFGGATNEIAYDGVLQANGRIVLAGGYFAGSGDFGITRHLP